MAEAAVRVAAFPCSSDEELITLRAADVQSVLRRFIEGGLTAQDVAAWANALEMREDVGYSAEVADALFVLSTPAINGALTRQVAEEMITRHGRLSN